MSLSISLSNNDRKPFRPGSMLLGVVKLVTHDDQPIGDLAIAFTGRASVLLIHSYGDMTTSRRDYKSVGYLFSQLLNLHQGNKHDTHLKGNYMWPFAFQIPLCATPRLVSPLGSKDKDCFPPEEPWKNDYDGVNQHPLPPSMAYSGPYLCSIEYLLHAKLTQPGRASVLLNRGLNAVKKVTVHTFSRPQDLDPSLDEQRRQPLYASYRHWVQCTLDDGMSHSIAETFCSPATSPLRLLRLCPKDRRRSESTNPASPPKVELHISVVLPKRIILEDHATTRLSVMVAASSHPVTESNNDNTNGSTEEQTPPKTSRHSLRHANLITSSFKLSLVQHTHVRAGCHRSSSERRIFVRTGSCILPVTLRGASTSSSLLEQPRPATKFSADQGGGSSSSSSSSNSSNSNGPPPPQPEEEVSIDLAKITDLTLPSTLALVPDFSTYNIARSHSLDVQFEMRYGEKRFKFSLRKIPLRILSPACYYAEEEDHQHTDLRPGDRRLNQITCASDLDGGGDHNDVWIVPPPSECDPNDDENIANALIAEPPPQYT
ncbi:uncharacterized protein A1O5_04945 [Cladophialophora psammophila CBS 110553]|uniref:Arrestin-like N-terminal domain-containing protein n=1 Tax=Cladophialophora psammophila CBS 110553 TaxID=1182543 RepID=W9X6A6_9EURO|nr:uncharacterized protein A1O5_04945 [Cladophialophora psammophila CBS 110553]EXJ72441.1 hypothetical protein A1O5_04945 [Cladophialophora psammophila CBS 110553]